MSLKHDPLQGSRPAQNVRVTYYDEEPDSLGRRRFALHWDDEGGVWRKELAKDGEPVGYRRSQHFFAKPEDHVPPDAVEVPE